MVALDLYKDIHKAIHVELFSVTTNAGRLVLRALAEGNVEAVSELRGRTHTLYLDLASFTSDYLTHQAMEEREIMPALDRAIGFEAVLAIHQAIVTSIPPAEFAQTLPLMMQATEHRRPGRDARRDAGDRAGRGVLGRVVARRIGALHV
jgi:hypothetical protein